MLTDIIIMLLLSRSTHHTAAAAEWLRLRDIAREEEAHSREVECVREHDEATGRARRWESWANALAWRVA